MSCSAFALFVCLVCELLNLLDLHEDLSMRSIWQPAVQRYIATIGPYFARASSKVSPSPSDISILFSTYSKLFAAQLAEKTTTVVMTRIER